MSFSKFDIPSPCLQVLEKQGIVDPTPIQKLTFSPAHIGEDVLGIAQTGTGKTLAFGLPSICRLSRLKAGPGSMLVLAPTRELAIQIHEVIEPLANVMKMRSACIYGGVGMQPQVNKLRRGVEIIIATPGRLLDHLNQKTLNFNNLSILVFDEADRMLDMGFLPDIRRIVSHVPAKRQTLMFSATFPEEMARLTKEFQSSPKRIEVGVISTPVDAVKQQLYTVITAEKTELLFEILGHISVSASIVFIRTKHRADRVAKQLQRQGFKAQPIHGGRSQNQRQRALDDFKKGKCDILVATDVAARGIDIQGVSHVINYDIPGQYEDYVHRIGRTARAKETGDAITFASPENGKELSQIEKGLGKPIPEVQWRGSVEIPRSAPPSPSKAKGNTRGRSNGAASDTRKPTGSGRKKSFSKDTNKDAGRGAGKDAGKPRPDAKKSGKKFYGGQRSRRAKTTS